MLTSSPYADGGIAAQGKTASVSKYRVPKVPAVRRAYYVMRCGDAAYALHTFCMYY